MSGRLTRRTVLRGSGTGLAGVLIGWPGETVTGVTHAQEGQEIPRTIPAIRHWTPNGGSYTYGRGSRIVLDPPYTNVLETDAETFIDDLFALTGIRSAVIPGRGSNPHDGDIFLTLDSTDDDLGEQGYQMTVDDVLTISAQTPTGVFNGTRTVLQLLRQSRTIFGGIARDWPTYPERGVLVANDDRRFPLEWWYKLIRELSYLKMNEIVLLLKKNGLSDAKIPKLAAFSERYRVNITPQINRPGHSPELLEKYPEYAIDPNRSSIDFTKPGAMELLKNEIKNYIDKFPGDYWHIGGDEYLSSPKIEPPWDDYPQLAEFARKKTGNPNATGQDAYVWFMNSISNLVKSHGKTLRMWNDHLQSGGVLELDDDIIVDDWINSKGDPTGLSPQQLIDRGHNLLNANLRYTYYDRGIDPREIYEEFEANQFHRQTVTATENVLGARYQLWALRDDENEEILEDMFTRLRSLSQVVWQDPDASAAYDEFRSLMDRIGHSPGYGVDIEVQAPNAIQTGTNAQVTTSFTNNSRYAAHNARLALDIPKGWTAQPTSQTRFSTVARNQTVTTNWQVSVPDDISRCRLTPDNMSCGKYDLTGKVIYQTRDGQQHESQTVNVGATPPLIPQIQLSAPDTYESGIFGGSPESFEIMATFANPRDTDVESVTAEDVVLNVTGLPDSWTITANTPTQFDAVSNSESVTANWEVVPDSTANGDVELKLEATYGIGRNSYRYVDIKELSALKIAYWRFENNNKDSSSYEHTVSLKNGARYDDQVAIEGNYSLHLDGSDDYAEIDKFGGEFLSTPFSERTISMWIKPDSTMGLRGLYNEGGRANGLAIRINDETLEVGVSTDFNRTTIASPFTRTDWTHIAVAFDNGTLRLYVNGTEVAAESDVGYDSVGQHIADSGIGSSSSGVWEDGEYDGNFAGHVDAMAIYSRALGADRISTLSKSP